MSHGIPMIASSPMRNDISNLQPGQQIEMHHANQAYASMSWPGQSGVGGEQLSHSGMYDHQINMSGFGSDEEDCFDQMSDGDGAGDDSSLDDTRLQQL